MNNNTYTIIKDMLMNELNYLDYQIREIKDKELSVGYQVSPEMELSLTIRIQNEEIVVLSSSIKYEEIIDPNIVLQLEDFLGHENISLRGLRVQDAATRLDFEEIVIVGDQEHFYSRLKSVCINFCAAIVKVYNYSLDCGAEPSAGLMYFSKYDEYGIEHWYDIVLTGDLISSGRKIIVFKDFKQESTDCVLFASSIDVESGQLSALNDEEYIEIENELKCIKINPSFKMR